MPPIQRYEWLCLRALKSRHYRYYATTTETSPPDQPSDNPPPSPPEPPNPTMGTTPDHIRTYLEQQDTLALTDLKTKLQTLQTTATHSEALLLAHQTTLSTTQLIPQIPPYTASLRSTNPSEIRLASATLQSRLQNLQNNIWDLENVPYRFERGASSAQRYGAVMAGLRGRREVEAERTEMRNRVDVYRKRWAQKMEGLRGMVDEMRRGLGLGKLARVGGGMGGTLGPGVVERERNPFEGGGVGGGKGEDAAPAVEEPEIGTAKIEAEAEAINPITPPSPTSETPKTATDTIGTAKIEAEASEVEAQTTPTPPPTGYTPLKITHQPSGTPSDPEDATLYNLHRAATRRKPPSITEKRAPGPKVKDPEPKLSSMERMNQLLSNLQADAAVKRGEVGDGGKGDVTEEKKGVDERRGNPFAK